LFFQAIKLLSITVSLPLLNIGYDLLAVDYNDGGRLPKKIMLDCMISYLGGWATSKGLSILQRCLTNASSGAREASFSWLFGVYSARPLMRSVKRT